MTMEPLPLDVATAMRLRALRNDVLGVIQKQEAETERLDRVILVQFQQDLADFKIIAGSDLRLAFHPHPHAQIVIASLTSHILDVVAGRRFRVLIVPTEPRMDREALADLQAWHIPAVLLNPDGTVPEIKSTSLSEMLRSLRDEA
jgi:hypothetical protein